MVHVTILRMLQPRAIHQFTPGSLIVSDKYLQEGMSEAAPAPAPVDAVPEAVDGSKAAEGESSTAPPTEAETEAALIETMKELFAAGKEMEKEVKESEEMGLAPGRTLRMRRKSKDLELQATALMAGKLEAVFKAVDTDGSGFLDADELKVAFEKAGLPASDTQIKQSIKALDTNNDGKIDLEEFKAIAWKNNVS